MKLDRLVLRNWGIFRDVDLDFSDKTVVGILGTYKNNDARSNFSGKTLIIEAIRYALTGVTRTKKEIDMIHHGTDFMVVETYFKDNNSKEYKIRRGRDKKNNGTLELDWVEKTRESQAAITNIFNVSKDDFELKNFFKQSDINGFMNLTPPQKTEYLMKTLDNTHWKEKEERVSIDIKAKTVTLKENEAILRSLEANTEIEEEIDSEIMDLKKTNKKLKSKLEKLKEEKEEIDSSASKIDLHNEKIKNKINDYRREIKIVIDSKEIKENIKRQISSYEEKVEECVSKITDLEFDNETYQAELKVLLKKQLSLEQVLELGGSNNICPVINEECDRITVSKETIKTTEKTVKSINKQLKKLKDEFTENEKNNHLENNIERFNDTILSQKRHLKSIPKTKLKISDLKDKVETLKNKFKNTEDDSDLRELKTNISEARSDISSNDKNISILEYKIEQAKKNLEKIDNLYDKNEVLTTKLEILKYVMLMFGKSGIPADEIENAFHQIQDRINYILGELDCGLTVAFSPDKELSKKELVCSCGFVYPKNYKKPDCEECSAPRRKARKDEISLQILENGTEVNFESNSGGQKVIVSYAVRIALTMQAREVNTEELDMLFLDEIDSALDDHLSNQIINNIANVLTKKLGYEQILMISHKDEIKKSVPHTLLVTRFKDYSIAEFV